MATNVTTTAPPDYLATYYEALAKRGADAANLGFTPYTQDRVAPWTQQQNDAASMIQQRALSGSPAMNTAQDWYTNMLAGNNGVSNIGASTVAAPGQIGAVTPTMGPGSIASGGTITPGSNPYLGMNNPYLNTAIGNAQADVSGTIGAKFNNNAFGGTAHQQTLARELGRVSNDMRMQDYTAQQGLAENAVNRGMTADTTNVANANNLNQFNANLGMTNAGIANTAGQFNAGLQGTNIANTSANNLANANINNSTAQFNAGLQGANIGRQQTALGFAPTLAQNDYLDAGALMGVGTQLQGTNQSIADANYQEFLRQQALPATQLGFMQAGLDPSKNLGTQTTTTNTAGNPLATAAGGALTGYSLYNMFNKA